MSPLWNGYGCSCGRSVNRAEVEVERGGKCETRFLFNSVFLPRLSSPRPCTEHGCGEPRTMSPLLGRSPYPRAIGTRPSHGAKSTQQPMRQLAVGLLPQYYCRYSC